MLKKPVHNRSTRGQVLVLAVALIGMCSTLFLGLFQVSLAVQEKIRLQLSADMAVLSALNCQANGLNSIAIANRAILANDATAAQLNALVSESTFYRKLAEKFKKLLRFIPYAGPASNVISSSVRTVETIIRNVTSIALPLAHYTNIALKKCQTTVRYLLPYYSVRAARTTLKENMPQAGLSIPSQALILRQARSLQRSMTETVSGTMVKIKEKTMNRHTLKRNWKINVAGLSPVKKSGGTKVSPKDLVAQDKMRLKTLKRLRWKWKTVLAAQSRASDFGYQTPAGFMSINIGDPRSPLSIAILVQSDLPSSIPESSISKRKLFALSAGQLIYRRDSSPDETANIFNPFWKTELIPVADVTAVKRIIPGSVLKGVRH